MQRKKTYFITILLVTIFFLLGIVNIAQAAQASQTKYLKIMMLRESGFGYQALDKAIWEIVETNSSGTTEDHSATIYCIKGGPGFGSTEFGNGNATERPYTQYFDLKDLDSISSTYRSALPSGNDYKALVWLLEHVYIAPANSSENAQAEEYRDQLLDAAGVNNGNLTDDDIDVVQQLAVWHFTNNDEYDAGDSLPELWINEVAGKNGNYNPLTDEQGEGGEYGWDRQYDAEDLYDYLITEAERAASSGYEPQPASRPYELANTTIAIEEQGSDYVIGPFRINQISDTTATLEGTFKNGNQTIHPNLQNASGGRFSNLQETVGQNFYIVLPQSTTLNTISLEISGSYYETVIEYWSVANAPSEDQPVVIVERESVTYRDDVSFTPPEKPEVIFDLALRKYISSINGSTPSTSRVPQINSSTLNDLENGRITTAEKIHPKTPLTVETGDNVVYTIRVYNEGNIDAIVSEITDYLPEGLTLRTGSSINSRYGWTASGDGRTVTTDYLQGTLLDAFNGTTLDYADVQIECTVTARVSEEDTNLKNIAEITEATDDDGIRYNDRDSTPDNVDTPYGDESQEDDDDFEDLVILGKYFDFALRKYITQIDGESVNRAPTVDVSQLTSGRSTTANYNHSKTPLGVKIGDEIIYTLRVYNEGQLDGYVTEITDYLPPELEYVNDSFNTSRGWVLQSDGRTVKTTSTSDELITAFNGSTLDYAEVQIKVRVKESATSGRKLTNIAEITGFTDASGEPINDRDSVVDNVTLPSDPTLPNYKDTEINRGDNYIPGQQDDDDFEKVVVEKFDLALRKFITGVNAETINNREPVFHNDNGNYTYEHTKDPVLVKTGDTVIYTLRVYNEGDIAGYAEEVKDDIPEGLEFLPENTTNINYRWEMYDAQGQRTDNVAEAVTIRTDYLSKSQADATRRDNLIEAFDPDTMSEPDYKEVRVAFKVVEPSSSDRVIINTAEISEDSDEDGNPIDDTDSTPDNDDEEDDTDIEKVVVQEFDLALRKFITHVNGAEVQTSREPRISMETIQKLINGEITTLEKLHTKTPVQVNTNDVIRYTIRIYNEGDIAGYASEVTDYLPEGLEFVEGSQINNEYGWSNPNGDRKTIVTDYLATRLLNGVEGTDVRYWDLQIECRVVATSGSSQSNLKNVAEITKATDEEGNEVPDRDSEEDNLTEEEKNNYNPGESEKGWGYEDDDDYEELVIPGATGEYEIKIIKENGLGNKLQGATFKVEEINAEGDVINIYDNLTTSANGEVVTGKIPITGEGTHTYIITELEAPDGYQLLTDPIRLEIQVQLIDGVYTVTASKVTRGTEQVEVKNGAGESTIQNTNYDTSEVVSTSISLAENVATLSTGTLDSAVNNIQMNGNTVEITVENNYFDLALRKFITHINNNPVATREPVISPETIQNLANRTITTAEKNHTKTPVQVNTGDIVRYTIRVYNEGEMAGYATEITDYLPDGLEFVDSEFNRGNGWSNPNGDGKTIVTTALAGKLIDAFNGSNVDYEDIQIECRVVAQKGITNINLKNVAEITKATDEEGNEVDDRDSQENDLTDEQKNNYNPGESEKGWGYEDDDDYEELVLPSANGDFELKLVKENSADQKLQGAIFKIEEVNAENQVINTYDNLTTNNLGEVLTGRIGITGEGTRYYLITEKQAPSGYVLLPEPIVLTVTTTLQDGAYTVTTQILNEDQTVGGTLENVQVIESNTIQVTIEDKYFDLALRKFITHINNNPVPTREPVISPETIQNLANGSITTAEKNHTKTPVQVNTGDIVRYTIRVYNEGEIGGYATEIVDYLPEGLELVTDSQINSENGWTNPSGDGRTIVSTTLAGKLIDAFNGSNIDYEDIQVECRVIAVKGATSTNLKNVAEITKATDENGKDAPDRDSEENNLTDDQKNNYNPGESEKGWGYEDDDDYEELTLPGATGEFNIKLIKVNGLGNRLQNAIFKIEEIGENGEVINTYDNLTTNENGEITISNIAIAQEGTYTYIITETQAPEGYTLLEGPLGIEVHVSLVNGEYQITANQIDVSEINTQTNEQSDKLAEIENTNANNKQSTEIVEVASYETPEINKKETEEKKVAQTTRRAITTNYWLTEVHQTQEETSKTTNVALADNNAEAEENAIANVLENAQANLANQRSVIKNLTINNNTVEITIENNFFDLALRKFITGVNEEPITNRVPVFHNNNGEYTYEHTKDPVEVANGDVVIYTLRIYNEGEIAGYAEEVKDDLPEGLEFLPENSTNTEYRWVMYDANGEVTENVAEAVSIRTDYLSKAQADATGRDNLIEGFDPETMTQPDYKDIQIAFRVTEPNTSDRILINTAEISEDADEDGEPVDDIDSTPDNDEEEEDDIDIEKVKVTYFDLALKKIISTLTMELDGKTYVEQTGHTFEDDPEEIVKIELGSNQIERATFKFTYQIRITNEGNKAGYAYEIKDYIPEGLEFVAEDNEGWVLNEDGTVTTDQLSEVLLQPGESATIEITLRWINKSDNLGVKTNWAEISEDSDDDIDSTPDNEVPGEDDIDDASVVLSIVTGIGGHYVGVIAGIVALLGTGVILIKKFVL